MDGFEAVLGFTLYHERGKWWIKYTINGHREATHAEVQMWKVLTWGQPYINELLANRANGGIIQDEAHE